MGTARMSLVASAALFTACTTTDPLRRVGDLHLREVPPAPFRVAVRPIQAVPRPDAAPSIEAELPLPTSEQLHAWTRDLASGLDDLLVSDCRVDVADQALAESPYDLAIQVRLDWGTPLRGESHDSVGAFLMWGFLWPFSVMEFAAVKDRAYRSSVQATIDFTWLDSQQRQVHEELGEFLLSLPERQPGIGWRLASFTPIYFWVPDDSESRNERLHRAIVERLTVLVARSVKLDVQHTFTDWTWEGDFFEVRPAADVHVEVLGGTRTGDRTKQRYTIQREAESVRIVVRRRSSSGTGADSWTQTLRRPQGPAATLSGT